MGFMYNDLNTAERFYPICESCSVSKCQFTKSNVIVLYFFYANQSAMDPLNECPEMSTCYRICPFTFDVFNTLALIMRRWLLCLLWHYVLILMSPAIVFIYEDR